MAEENMNQKHFVLVHGVCHGAWCWYKVKSQLQSKGHKVTALDLTASGINTKRIEHVETFSEYVEPLMELLASIPPNEKVVLVGHSFGGLSIAFALDKFPDKISVGIFLTAYAPDTLHKPSYVLEEYVERYPITEWLDSSVGGKPLLNINPQLLSTKFYQLCSDEDVELAKSLIRRGTYFLGEGEGLTKAEDFSRERYGSVPIAYIACGQDLVIPLEFQRWTIQIAGIEEVVEIKGADHMAMLSKPQELGSSLLQIAGNHA